MRRFLRLTALGLFLTLILGACDARQMARPPQAVLKIDYEKYTLDNGLEVILHEDKSDPIVAVALIFHVGSNREQPGRTGFAHLFEHILFQESENVGQDEFFRNIQGAGGTLNGGTWQDGTIYYEVVPKNALEMVLWMESDRMGYLLGKVTQAAFENQQDVVRNEKRQSYDNRPYGHTSYVIDKSLYPEGHPYNWQVIGSMEDLQNATLEDVTEFFLTWYGPNNATLVIAGDFDHTQTKAFVEKYFGDIQSSEPVEDPPPWPVALKATKRVFHEDNFANSPELNMVFPTVQEGHPDAAPLDLLGELLSDGKRAPLFKVIVEDKKLAPTASGRQSSSEIAGTFNFRVRAFPDVSLSAVEQALFDAFELFETEGFTELDMARVKANTQTVFYNGIASVLNKSFQLAQYNEYYGSPDAVTQYLQDYLDVTQADVLRVYNTYIKDRPYILTSFVPKDKVELVAEGSDRFPIEEEDLPAQTVSGQEAAPMAVTVKSNPTSFDRSVQPPFGPDPSLQLPEVWHHLYPNGLALSGILHDELPLVQFSITLKGGQLLDQLDKIGVANMVTDLMMEGTRTKTPQELEEAIDDLGASISLFTGRESIVIQANALASKFEQTYALVEEILLDPRWDAAEFERHKDENLEMIHRSSANPASIASNTFRELIYGPDNILATPAIGTAESVSAITIEDLKTYYTNYFTSSVAYITVVGDVSKARAIKTFGALVAKWPGKQVIFPDLPSPQPIDQSRFYFVDVPAAKQSHIRIGYLALPYTDPDYYPASVMNYKLGGSFNGILNLILREEKGYTYGARSGFSGSHYPGPFTASSAVRTDVTYESLVVFREILGDYAQGISEEHLAFTKAALIKSNARRFETLGALMGMLNQIAQYDLPDDYIEARETFVRELTLDQHRALAQKYIVPDQMIYLVVGDAATQLEPLKELGLGDPILIEAN